MGLGHIALYKRATNFEQSVERKFQYDPASLSVLESLLLDFYAILHPGPRDYELRKRLVQTFDKMVKDSFGSKKGFPVVEAFGSFTMNLFSATSDLDLSINFSHDKASDFPRERKISVLKQFARVLYTFQNRGHVSGVFPIMKARVPVVKAVDCGTGIEFDISVENKDGISRSLIFAIISSIDERFRILCYLMKLWAKIHDINSSKDGTMSSMTIISLVAFHLQTRDPPILPSFSALFKDGMDITSVQNVAIGLKSFGQRNKESIAKLFVTLLNKLSAVESLWEHGLCASTYEGSWIKKTWASQVGNLSVEDFLDRSENFARAVGKDAMHKIYKCIEDSLHSLSCFMKGEINATKLKKELFESFASHKPSNQLICSKGMDPKRKYPFDTRSDPPFVGSSTKRARYVESAGEHYPGHGEQSGLHLSIPPVPYAPPQFHNRLDQLEPSPIAIQLARASHNLRQNPALPHYIPFNQLGHGLVNQLLHPIPFGLHHGLVDRNLVEHSVLSRRWEDGPRFSLPGYRNQGTGHPLNSSGPLQHVAHLHLPYFGT